METKMARVSSAHVDAVRQPAAGEHAVLAVRLERRQRGGAGQVERGYGGFVSPAAALVLLLLAICAHVVAADSISMKSLAGINSVSSSSISISIISISSGGTSFETVAGVVQRCVHNHAVCACSSVTAKSARLQVVSLGVELMWMVRFGAV